MSIMKRPISGSLKMVNRPGRRARSPKTALSALPAIRNTQTAQEMFRLFSQSCASFEATGHHFWPENLSILEILKADAIITHAQITDVYLLGLAVRNKGKLATLDQRIPVDTVRGGRQALELVIS